MLTQPAYVPPQWIPSGVMLTEWTTGTEVRRFEAGRESMGGSATVVVVSDTECEFRFNNYWSAGDVGWPKELSLAGSLHIEPNGVLRVRLWTTRGVITLATVLCGVPAMGSAIMLLMALVTGHWDGVGKWLLGALACSAIVALSLRGAKRFGEDAVKVANGFGAGA